MRATDLNRPQAILVIVHPGSACGSADFNLGDDDATQQRARLTADIQSWTGRTLIVDGNLSNELPAYPVLNAAIVKAAGSGERIFACAEETRNWPARVAKALAKLDPTTSIEVTGCWRSHQNESGCVNTVAATAKEMGFAKVSIRPSAMEEDYPADQSYEEEL